MLSKYSDKNKFNGETWQIKLDSIFHIFVHGTDSNSYVVELKEWKWIKYKVLFSFVSTNPLDIVFVEAFDKAYDFFQRSDEYNWTISQKENKLNQALDLLSRTTTHLFSNKTKSSVRETYKILLKEFIDSPQVKLVNETDNFIEFSWVFEESNTVSHYSVRRDNNMVIIFWKQENDLGKLSESWEFPMNEDQMNIKLKVNKGMQEVLKKRADDLLNKFYKDNS